MNFPAASHTVRPRLGLAAVLFGAFVSTLGGRLSTFGLSDVRGAMGLGVDEAAWINTAFAVAQMLVAPLAVWATPIFGPRRVLLAGCALFAAASAMQPLAPGYPTFLALQFLSGLGSGTFMPITILVVLKGLSPLYWGLGIALYALNIEASVNIAASVEGFYVDHLSWKWIFWQNVLLATAMAACIRRGIARQPADLTAARKADVFGMATLVLGCALLYAGLDQGNRLDWLASGLIVALLGGGLVLLCIFAVHESLVPKPWIDLRLLVGGFLPILLILVCEVRFAALGTGFLVPQFLASVRGFRPPEIGEVLIWVVIPQLVAVPLAAAFLRIIDPRTLVITGLAMIFWACWFTANRLTAQWAASDFLGTLLVQSLGQTFAISGAIFIGLLNLKPQIIPSFGALIQVARLLGGEIGLALMTTLVRVREQVASHVIGWHVQAGDLGTMQRLQAMAAGLVRRGDGAGTATAQSLALLGQSVRAQAMLQACVDGFMAIAASSVLALILLLALKRPPRGPASPIGAFDALKKVFS